MRNRVRSAWRAVRRGATAVGTFIADQIGRDELLLAGGLALVSVGLWETWRPGAYLVPGLVMLWIGLPSRAAFVERPSVAAVRKRKD